MLLQACDNKELEPIEYIAEVTDLFGFSQRGKTARASSIGFPIGRDLALWTQFGLVDHDRDLGSMFFSSSLLP